MRLLAAMLALPVAAFGGTLPAQPSPEFADTEMATNGPTVVQTRLTSVKVELEAEKVAPLNSCQQRHTYGVGEAVSFEGLQFVEIPDESHSCPHDRQGYYADESKGGPLSHTQQAGAGRWLPANSQAFFGTDAAGTHESYSQPWQNGWKSWPIPMGWGYGIEVLGRFRGYPTFQTFTLSSDGTFRIDKFNHWSERNTLGMIWVDGSLQVSPWPW